MKAMQEFIEKLELTPHVEGGYFKETYRSETLHTIENGKQRSLATLIYFLLPIEMECVTIPILFQTIQTNLRLTSPMWEDMQAWRRTQLKK